MAFLSPPPSRSHPEPVDTIPMPLLSSITSTLPFCSVAARRSPPFGAAHRSPHERAQPRPQEDVEVRQFPHAVALVRSSDKSSPIQATEFILQLLKYNDNNGYVYLDVYCLVAMVQAIGEVEFGQQGIGLLSSLLKSIDRLLQFDNFMPGYNGVFTVSSIRALARIAERVSSSIRLDRICELITPFRNMDKPWKVQIEASRFLLDLELHHKGLDAALLLFLKYADEEKTL